MSPASQSFSSTVFTCSPITSFNIPPLRTVYLFGRDWRVDSSNSFFGRFPTRKEQMTSRYGVSATERFLPLTYAEKWISQVVAVGGPNSERAVAGRH